MDKDEWFNLWRRAPIWIKCLLFIISNLLICCLSYYVAPLVPHLLMLFLEEFKVSGLIFLMFFVFLVILGVITYMRQGDVLATLREIGGKLGVGPVEITRSVVYPDCRWLILSRPVETDWETRLRRIYVRCSHSEKPYTGCPVGCPKFEKPPKPGGSGAFAGLIVGSLLGLTAGPLGVVLGGLIGAGLGHAIEVARSTPKVRRELRSCEGLGLKWEIHVEDHA